MRSARLFAAVVIAALALAACAGADDLTPDPAGPPVSGASDPAGGTAPRVYTLEEAIAADPEGPILVTGMLIDSGDGWQLCSLAAESYPPQCGGEMVTVEGVDPAEFDLEEANGVRWQQGATLYGELDGDTFTVTGPASAA